MKAPLITGLLLAIAAPAAAGDHARKASAFPAASVRHDDLNLNASIGTGVMLTRIEAAARKVCGPAPLIQELGASSRHRACVEGTMDDAVAKLNAPMVTAVHHGRNPAMLASR